jgi:hypothetical protein
MFGNPSIPTCRYWLPVVGLLSAECAPVRPRVSGVVLFPHTIQIKLEAAEDSSAKAVQVECILTVVEPAILEVTMRIAAREHIVVRDAQSIMFVAPLDATTNSIFHGIAPEPRGHEYRDRAYWTSRYTHLFPGEQMVVSGALAVDWEVEEPRAAFYGPPLSEFRPIGCTLSYWLMSSVPTDNFPFDEMIYVHTERLGLRAVKGLPGVGSGEVGARK